MIYFTNLLNYIIYGLNDKTMAKSTVIIYFHKRHRKLACMVSIFSVAVEQSGQYITSRKKKKNDKMKRGKSASLVKILCWCLPVSSVES